MVDLLWMLHQSDQCPKLTVHPKKPEPCVGGLDGTDAFHLQRKALWPGPGYVHYITSATESPVSPLNLPFWLPSAVEIAPVFCWILRISVDPSYNLFFFLLPAKNKTKKKKCATNHLHCLLQTCSSPPNNPTKGFNISGEVEWKSALKCVNMICTCIRNTSKPGASVFIWEGE